MWTKEKNKEAGGGKQSSVDLSDVIKGMQNAVNEAQKMLEMHNLKSLRSFFHNDGDPKTIELHLDENNYLEVPILALANHNSLVIDSLSMEFEARIEQVGIKNAEDLLLAVTKTHGDAQAEQSTSSVDKNAESEHTAVFGIGFAGQPNNNTIKVKLEFAAAKRSEGLSRILDEYNKLVVPYAAATGTDNSPWKDHDHGDRQRR